MNGIGNDFHPSAIEDVIYEICNDHSLSSHDHERTVGPAIINYMENCGVQFNIIEDPFPDMSGASLSLCWIEDGYLHHIVIDLKY